MNIASPPTATGAGFLWAVIIQVINLPDYIIAAAKAV